MTKKELDSITEQDLDFIANLIINYNLSIESAPILIDKCNVLSKKFKISCFSEICEVRGYYYVDAEFGNMEICGICSIKIEDGRQFCKYLKEYGSGKYDFDLDRIIEEEEGFSDNIIYRDLEFGEEDMEQLPSFLYFGGYNEHGDIEVKSTRDDISCYYESVSKSYYYQP